MQSQKHGRRRHIKHLQTNRRFRTLNNTEQSFCRIANAGHVDKRHATPALRHANGKMSGPPTEAGTVLYRGQKNHTWCIRSDHGVYFPAFSGKSNRILEIAKRNRRIFIRTQRHHLEAMAALREIYPRSKGLHRILLQTRILCRNISFHNLDKFRLSVNQELSGISV